MVAERVGRVGNGLIAGNGQQMRRVVGNIEGKRGCFGLVSQLVQTKVAVLKLVHAGQRFGQQPREQNPHGPAVHSHQYRRFVMLSQDMGHSRALPGHHLFGAFALLGGESRVPRRPIVDQVLVITIVEHIGHFSFHDAPANFVEARQLLERNTQLDKRLNGLVGTYQGRRIKFGKRHVLISLKKSLRLRPTHLVQVGVDTAALHNTPAVVVGFAVADYINVFIGQIGWCYPLSNLFWPQKYLKTSA